MFRKFIIMVLMSVFAFSLGDSTGKNPREVLQRSFELIKAKGMEAKLQKSTNSGESYHLMITDLGKLMGLPEDINLTDKNTSSSFKDPMEGLKEIKIGVDVNYTHDGYHGAMYLAAFPDDESITKPEKAIIKRIIDEKIVLITSYYDVNTNHYTAALRDIDEKFESIDIKCHGFDGNGTYDMDNLDIQESRMKITSLQLTPTIIENLGEYFTLKNGYATIETTPKDNLLDFHYHIGAGLVDMNASGVYTKVENPNFDIKITNLDRVVYKKLAQMSQTNQLAKYSPQAQQELIDLMGKLITEKTTIELLDMSLTSFGTSQLKIGSAKVNAKISLVGGEQLREFLKISPLMALSALEAEAKIELSKDAYDLALTSPQGSLISDIKPIMVNEKVTYTIKYSKNVLSVNGKPLPKKGY